MLLAAILSLLAACGGSDENAAADPTAAAPTAEAASATATAEPLPQPTFTAVPSPVPTAPPAPSATAVPESDSAAATTDPAFQDSPGLRAISRIVGWINGDQPLAEEYETVFSQEMIDALPYDDFTLIRLQLRSGAPLALSEPENAGDQAFAVVRDRSGANPLRVSITMQNGLVAGLFFEPMSDGGTPETRAAAEEQLNDQGELTYLVAQVADPAHPAGANPDNCADASDAREPDRLIPLGSVFKLYVLGTVIDAVEAGEISWDQGVPIRDELDSHPSGFTQDEAAGSELTVRTLAERMISISDNTATDHLMDLVGRDSIEAALAKWGHSNPEATMPFMTTGELFRLKSSSFRGELDQYLSADTETRRSLLADVAAQPLPGVAEFTATPLAVNEAEWFATARDLCRVIVMLRANDEAARILAAESGLNSGNPAWDYIGSKGGSEPGVLAVASLVEPGDGQVMVVVVSMTSEASNFGFSTLDNVVVFRDLAVVER